MPVAYYVNFHKLAEGHSLLNRGSKGKSVFLSQVVCLAYLMSIILMNVVLTSFNDRISNQ